MAGASGQTAWIAGGGRFGRRAARLLAARGMPCRIIEKDARRCAELAAEGFGVECADAVGVLAARLPSEVQTVWVVAAVPFHFAFRWLKRRLSPGIGLRRKRIAEPARLGLPNLIAGASGDLYASHADFLCPKDCREGGCCPVTGKERPPALHRSIAALALPGVKILVVRSYQLAAGVGGMRGRDLEKARDIIERGEGPFLLATSCNCHAVLTYFKKSMS